MRNLALIQQKFERSSLSYNKNAIAQREIADDLYHSDNKQKDLML